MAVHRRRTAFERGGLLEVEQEERCFWDRLFLELGLVSLFDLLEIEDGLPLGVGLIRQGQVVVLCFLLLLH